MTPQEALENIVKVLQLDSMSLLTKRMTDSAREQKFNELTAWGIGAILDWQNQTKGGKVVCENNNDGKLPEVQDVKNIVSGNGNETANAR